MNQTIREKFEEAASMVGDRRKGMAAEIRAIAMGSREAVRGAQASIYGDISNRVLEAARQGHLYVEVRLPEPGWFADEVATHFSVRGFTVTVTDNDAELAWD